MIADVGPLDDQPAAGDLRGWAFAVAGQNEFVQ